MDRALFVCAVLSASLVAGGCGDDAPPAACDDDTRIDCICAETGASGFIACDDGVLGACVCQVVDAGDVCSEDIQCDDGAFCNGEERCLPDAEDADERGCVNGMFVPFCEDDLDCTVDTCSDELNRCVHLPPDADNDGHYDDSCIGPEGEPLGDDCDDGDPMRFPGNLEICDPDDRDEDCDPTTFGDKDSDGDGAIDDACCNGDNCGDDCDDTRLSRRPQQPEFCDDLDNDCDGTVDEDAVEVPWYVDADGDGFGGGGADDVQLSCYPIPGRSLVETDCADGNPMQHPAQLEICDLTDNNCDGAADEGQFCGTPEGHPVEEPGGVVGGGDPLPGTGGVVGGGGGMGGSGGMDGSGGDMGPVLPDVIECPSRDVDGATEVTGAVADGTTWSGVIRLMGEVRVPTGVHLTIAPGTRIVADSGAHLDIGWNGGNGRITAVGTEQEPITLCGSADLPGYWEGVTVRVNTDPASEIAWTLISDGGGAAGTRGGLVMHGAVPLSDVHVTNGSGVGIEASNFGPGGTRVISTGNADVPLSILEEEAVTRLPTDSAWVGNGSDVIEILDTAFNANTTMHPAGVPYLIKNDLNFAGDHLYRMEAGVHVLVETDVFWDIGWNSNASTLMIDGTVEAPVVIEHASGVARSWDGIRLGAAMRSDSHIRNLILRHAGQGVPALEVRPLMTLQNVTLDTNGGPALMIEAPGLQPQSANITVTNTDGTAVSIDSDAITRLGASITLSNNTNNWIELQQSTYIESSGTIRNLGAGTHYYLPFTNSTRAGSAIVIEPGVTFKVGNNASFEVGWNNTVGSIEAVGTVDAPIVFEHVNNERGLWGGIELSRNISSGSHLEHVHIKDGGDGGRGNLYINMVAPIPAENLANCRFEHSSNYGIYLSADGGIDYSGNGNVFADIPVADIFVP